MRKRKHEDIEENLITKKPKVDIEAIIKEKVGNEDIEGLAAIMSQYSPPFKINSHSSHSLYSSTISNVIGYYAGYYDKIPLIKKLFPEKKPQISLNALALGALEGKRYGLLKVIILEDAERLNELIIAKFIKLAIELPSTKIKTQFANLLAPLLYDRKDIKSFIQLFPTLESGRSHLLGFLKKDSKEGMEFLSKYIKHWPQLLTFYKCSYADYMQPYFNNNEFALIKTLISFLPDRQHSHITDFCTILERKPNLLYEKVHAIKNTSTEFKCNIKDAYFICLETACLNTNLCTPMLQDFLFIERILRCNFNIPFEIITHIFSYLPLKHPKLTVQREIFDDAAQSNKIVREVDKTEYPKVSAAAKSYIITTWIDRIRNQDSNNTEVGTVNQAFI